LAVGAPKAISTVALKIEAFIKAFYPQLSSISRDLIFAP
jgi:hypothetical protein